MNERVGWIWCEGNTIVGVAADGTEVQLGQTLFRVPGEKCKPGYPIIPMDAHTAAYLKANPTPDMW